MTTFETTTKENLICFSKQSKKKTDILTSYTCLLVQRNIKLKAEKANFFENFQTAVSRGGSLRQKKYRMWNYRAL